eukprot:CAMPEP_0168340214 /NCGR_PEP_ID=MMETSP0213-20121227/13930_1 /TAXON_ID=151035 /ORGANISM="Euplotes harpa, Strain FSP1.4" /LENGTH=494 /DNA_ID=CAMNT_0008346407 /DNA_START=2203 /DNA_END=3688 /DNA_ORIENTATION=-
MPQHLWHDIENFIKSESVNKYCWQDSSELDSLPASIEESSIGQIGFLPAFEIGSQIAGASTVKLPSQEECEEIYEGLLEIYHSNEDVDQNKALLQRAKEIKNWCRKLLKKLRTKKTSSLSDVNKNTSKVKEPKIRDDDDIFISDEELDGVSDYELDDSSSDEEDREAKFEEKVRFYSEFYDRILNFISDFIGDDIFQDYIRGHKKASKNPFVFEVFQANNAKKITKNKKQNQKKKEATNEKKSRLRTESTTSSIPETPESKLPIDSPAPTPVQAPLPKLPKPACKAPRPAPTVPIEEPEYHYVEIKGEYKYVRQTQTPAQPALKPALNKKKLKTVSQWGIAEEGPKVTFEEIQKREMQAEEEKRARKELERERQVEEEVMRLAIEISMREFEDEQKAREEEERKNQPPKNELAKLLASEGAKSKYSKQGFVPKNLKKMEEVPKAQENVSENQYYNEYYDEYYDENYYYKGHSGEHYRNSRRGGGRGEKRGYYYY